ncbi:MAG: methyltransferase domain-containing protein [Ardenticatenia bacterium]|nr:methyltransferase domain-containing protein [Ardenticatenia bacterium]
MEVTVPRGLEAVAADEVEERFGARVRLHDVAPPGAVAFDFGGPLEELLALRTVLAVYLCRRYPVPRPKALLGHQHFRELLAQVNAVQRLMPPAAFRLLALSAAGAHTPVMERLKDELAAATGLAVASHEGDLQIRLRRPVDGRPGWDVLVRLTPRPLSARPWRVCHLEGGLNAAIAAAMVCLTRPRADDVIFNPGCGSGTLLVERLAVGPARRAIGCDTDPQALACARRNVEAAGVAAHVELYSWDARATPLPSASVDVICADLPFGHLVGSHEENVELYPALVDEAARVAKPGARAAFITHEVRLMEDVMAHHPIWELRHVVRVTQGGLHPRIFVAVRRCKSPVTQRDVHVPGPPPQSGRSAGE